jgi:hypothetical protein
MREWRFRGGAEAGRGSFVPGVPQFQVPHPAQAQLGPIAAATSRQTAGQLRPSHPPTAQTSTCGAETPAYARDPQNSFTSAFWQERKRWFSPAASPSPPPRTNRKHETDRCTKNPTSSYLSPLPRNKPERLLPKARFFDRTQHHPTKDDSGVSPQSPQ